MIALMVNDFEASNLDESQVVGMEEEVRSLSGEDLDKTLAERLDLPYPVDQEVLDRALSRVEEPERLTQSGPGGFTGAPDMSHYQTPEEREGGPY